MLVAAILCYMPEGSGVFEISSCIYFIDMSEGNYC